MQKHVVRVVFVAFMAVALFGCGGEEAPATPEQRPVTCSAPGGLYRMTSVQMEGNCGPVASAVINFDTVPQPSAGRLDPACTGSSAPTANGCVFTFEQNCDLAGLVFTNTGKATWNVDASLGKVTRQLSSASAASGVCSATYEDTYQRL